jgi:hypothetical protein
MLKGDLYTKDQKTRILMDNALFSDSFNLRASAVAQLATDYRLEAIPIIQEIIRNLPSTDEKLLAFCTNVIGKIREQVGSPCKRLVGIWP